METIWESEPDLDALRRSHAMLAANPLEALKELRKLADRGSVMSMIYIANSYRTGVGTDKDLYQAQEWYRCAAQKGSPLAAYELGRIYLEENNYVKAREAFESGSAKNYAPSMHMLARMYLLGTGVTRDISRAKDLLEQAVSLGHVFSKRNLGVLLLKGCFGPSKIPRGILLIASAIKEAVYLGLHDPTSDRLR